MVVDDIERAVPSLLGATTCKSSGEGSGSEEQRSSASPAERMDLSGQSDEVCDLA